MIRKENFKKWAQDKFWNDRCSSPGAYMDAMDGFGSARGMTKEQRCNFEITREEFWQDGGLDMAYQEYLERDLWERSHLGTALRINNKIDFQCAMAYCNYNDNYHRFGRPLIDRLCERTP
jgi:hypothetical protein